MVGPRLQRADVLVEPRVFAEEEKAVSAERNSSPPDVKERRDAPPEDRSGKKSAPAFRR